MLREKAESNFESDVKRLKSRNLDDVANGLNSILQTLFDQQTKSFAKLSKFREETQKTHEQKLKDMIHDSANNVEEGFAANLQEGYCENT